MGEYRIEEMKEENSYWNLRKTTDCILLTPKCKE
jgi:hypothetical protein